MKNLMLGISGVLLLAIQVNAQEGSVSTNASTSYSAKVATGGTVVSKSYSKSVVTVNGDAKTNTSVSINYNNNAQDDQEGPEKAKTFSKSFAVDKNDKINLSNQFGSLTIKTWDKNEIKVDADIKSYASSDSEAQKVLDQTSITATKEGDLITFRTNIAEGNWGSGSRNGVKWRHEVKIYMTVYMPASNSLTASQQYGNLVLGDFSGPTSLKVQYGNLTTGDLKNANNNIVVQYSKTILQDVNAATIKAQYGGGITIASIGGSLDLNAQYVRFKLGTLRGNVKAKIQYGGGFLIDNIENGNRAIDVDSQYAPISLGFATNYGADFTASVSYNSFNYGDNITAKRIGGDDRSYTTTKSYNGQIGKGGSAKVSVTNQYSSITFK